MPPPGPGAPPGPVLVTGASGFLGRHIVRELDRAGYRTRLLMRRREHPGSHEVEVEGDLLDPASLAAAMSGVAAVVHAAGLVSTRPRDREQLHRVNVLGARNLLDAAAHAGVKRVVFTSSTSAVGALEHDAPGEALAEDAPFNVARLGVPYIAAKRAAHEMALKAGEGGLDVVVLSPTFVLGPAAGRRASSHDLVEAFVRRQLPACPRGGVNIVDVRDLARAYVAALAHPDPARHYILAGPENLTFSELFQRFERLSGINAPRLEIPNWCALAAGYVGQWLAPRGPLSASAVRMGALFWYYDGSAARRDLGLTPRPLDQTLADTLADTLAQTAPFD